MQTRRNWLALVIATSILAATDYSKALDVAADVVEIQREDASEYGIIVEESKQILHVVIFLFVCHVLTLKRIYRLLI